MRRYMYCALLCVSLLLVACADLNVSLFSPSLPPSLTLSLVLCRSVSCLFSFGPFLHRDLSNNQISELASDAFQGLRSLNSL